MAGATEAKEAELGLSDLAWLGMLDETRGAFVTIPSSNYEDCGTLESWCAYCRSFKTLIVDLDGMLERDSEQNLTHSCDTAAPLRQNVDLLNARRKTGRVKIILTTSRPESFREVTQTQLREFGVTHDHILFGMQRATGIVTSNYVAANPYMSAVALSLGRDQANLLELLYY